MKLVGSAVGKGVNDEIWRLRRVRRWVRLRKVENGREFGDKSVHNGFKEGI